MHAAGGERFKLLALLGLHAPSDWQAFANFACHVRQQRRNIRQDYSKLEHRISTESFEAKRDEWRSRGFTVCRHGVFFACAAVHNCFCTSDITNGPAACHARHMPRIDPMLKAIVTVPFCSDEYIRIGLLRAELKRKGW